VHEYLPLFVPGPNGGAFATRSVVYADYIRRVGFVGGEPEFLIPARVQIVAPMSHRCLRQLSGKDRQQQLKLEKADRARGVILVLVRPTSVGTVVTYRELIGGPDLLREIRVPTTPAFADLMYGVVPDGVSSVVLLSENNPEITVLVTTNFFSIEVPLAVSLGLATVIWRDASGHSLKSIPYRPAPR
jgi:hypothetical protein